MKTMITTDDVRMTEKVKIAIWTAEDDVSGPPSILLDREYATQDEAYEKAGDEVAYVSSVRGLAYDDLYWEMYEA